MRSRPIRLMPGLISETAEVPYERPAPRQQVAYRCARGHGFEVAFAFSIDVPIVWECRCGSDAVLAGAISADARSTAAADRDEQWHQIEHERRIGQVLQRRSLADLERLLAERLAELAVQRGDGRPILRS